MSLGKLLILLGGLVIIIGLVIQYHDRIPWLGKLPGDILIERENTRIYFPIMTSVLISILLSLIIYIVNKLRG